MSWSRRGVLRAGLAAAAASLAGCSPGRAAWRQPDGTASAAAEGAPGPAPVGTSGFGPAEGARPASAAQLVFTPGRTLKPAAAPAPYAGALADVASRYLRPSSEHPRACYTGAVILAAVDGTITAHRAVGDALRYGVGPTELPPAERVAMRPDSIFDTASLTKIFTALLTLQQADQGRLDLAAPVSRYLPEFASRPAVTVRMLLTHTAGLPVGIDMSGTSGAQAQRAKIVNVPLANRPGTLFQYSSAGPMILAVLLEKLTGQPIDALLKARLCTPLGLRDTGYNAKAWASLDRIVATDARPARGLLRGVVHDGNAALMGGVAGHAGVFSTARDLAVIGQLLVNGGEYAGTRILGEAMVRQMLTTYNAGLPVRDADHPNRPPTHGLGVNIGQSWYMGRLSSSLTFGHTGFTGTSVVVEPHRRIVLVVLTNRAHPDWTKANPDPVRVAAANVLAAA